MTKFFTKMPEIFFPIFFFWGGGEHVPTPLPLPLPSVSYAYEVPRHLPLLFTLYSKTRFLVFVGSLNS